MTGSAGQNSSNATKLLATPDSDGPFLFSPLEQNRRAYNAASGTPVRTQLCVWILDGIAIWNIRNPRIADALKADRLRTIRPETARNFLSRE